MLYTKPEVVSLKEPAISIIQGSTSGVKTSMFQDGLVGQPDLATNAAYEADE